MRRRWHVSAEWFGNLAMGWLVFGFVGFLVVAAIAGGRGRAAWIALAVFLGPVALAVAGLLAVGFVSGTLWLWRNRPRRIVDAVIEDLRSTVKDDR